MKRLFTFLLLVIVSVSYGQTFDASKLQKNELYGQRHKRWMVDSVFIVPTTGDTLTKYPGQLKILSNNFMYTGQDQHWHLGGGSGGGISSTTYTKLQVDSAIAANKARFGIEDNFGIQDRHIDFQSFNFLIDKLGSFETTSGEYGVTPSSDVYMTPDLYTATAVNTTGNFLGAIRLNQNSAQLQSNSPTSNNSIQITNNIGDGIILYQSVMGSNSKYVLAKPTLSYNRTFDEGPFRSVLPVSVNGIFADSTGNIDLGTIGGSVGVTSFNSRSGAVVSQFTDYSAYYQPLGRYIDSLRRVGTTVSGLINGEWIPQYTDSVGTSSPQVNSDWSASSGVAQILNKPTIPTTTSQLTNNSGFLTANQSIAVTATGDATGTSSSSATAPSLPLTLATVNSNVGTFTNATVTVDAKGRITGVSNGSTSSSNTDSLAYRTLTIINDTLLSMNALSHSDTIPFSKSNSITSASITWPTGSAYTTPTTGSIAGGSLSFSPALATQTASRFYGSPFGSSGTPTFRALVAADIPNLSESQITNLSTDLAGKLTGGSIVWPSIFTTPTTGSVSSGVITYSPSLATQAAKTFFGTQTATTPSFLPNTVLDSTWIAALHTQDYYDARYAAIGSTGGGSSTGWALTGNAATSGSQTGSFLGTTNLTPIRFRTNNLERMVLDSLGRLVFNFNTTTSSVGIGSLEFQSIAAGNSWISENLYYNGSIFTPRVTGVGTIIRMNAGDINIQSSPSTTSGSSATLTTNFYLAANGYGAVRSKLSVGGTPDGAVAAQFATLDLRGGDLNNTYTNSSIALSYNGGGYSNLIHSRHNGSGTENNAIDFYTATGNYTQTIANSTHNLTLTNGRAGFGVLTPALSAKVEISSTTQGFLPPRMTSAQRLAISSPAVGLHVYQTDGTEGVYVNKSTGWVFAY